jgi:hypothetical protein
VSRYEYVHRRGYGGDDHLAEEVIARAARILGAQDAAERVAQCVGLQSHAVPMAAGTYAIDAGPGVRARMERALRAAYSEMPCRVDCLIEVVCVCVRRASRDEYSYPTWLREERRGRHWVVVATWDAHPETVCGRCDGDGCQTCDGGWSWTPRWATTCPPGGRW